MYKFDCRILLVALTLFYPPPPVVCVLFVCLFFLIVSQSFFPFSFSCFYQATRSSSVSAFYLIILPGSDFFFFLWLLGTQTQVIRLAQTAKPSQQPLFLPSYIIVTMFNFSGCLLCCLKVGKTLGFT